MIRPGSPRDECPHLSDKTGAKRSPIIPTLRRWLMVDRQLQNSPPRIYCDNVRIYRSSLHIGCQHSHLVADRRPAPWPDHRWPLNVSLVLYNNAPIRNLQICPAMGSHPRLVTFARRTSHLLHRIANGIQQTRLRGDAVEPAAMENRECAKSRENRLYLMQKDLRVLPHQPLPCPQKPRVTSHCVGVTVLKDRICPGRAVAHAVAPSPMCCRQAALAVIYDGFPILASCAVADHLPAHSEEDKLARLVRGGGWIGDVGGSKRSRGGGGVWGLSNQRIGRGTICRQNGAGAQREPGCWRLARQWHRGQRGGG